MIGSFSHKLGNLKIKSALVFAILYFIFATGQKNYATATPDTLSVNSFDVTKNLLIMIVFCLSNDCNLRFHDYQKKSKKQRN
jgi:hypothetical protein